ncbi:hypothetical protein AVEN_123003-1 [Araneus ventricosus]|uniref:Uncharacterized protein n=1 Tax=Araneus ventricosus TaxID=182803 RepID=A0A4Y2CUE5_ARAVE|nr:hypothetical protein AVEN_123003-1 [Araneus ventricosus]
MKSRNTVEPRKSELIGADLCSDSGEFGLSGKFGKILLVYQMQQSIDSGCSVKPYGKSTRRLARYSRKQVEGSKSHSSKYPRIWAWCSLLTPSAKRPPVGAVRCGSLERDGSSAVPSSDHGSKLRGRSQDTLRVFSKRGLNVT